MENPLMVSEMTSNPAGSSPENLVGNITNNKDMLFFASVIALAFFGIYAYKTYLEVKVARQALMVNEQELELNKRLLEDQG